VCNHYYVAHDVAIIIDWNHYVLDTNKLSDNIRYSFSPKRSSFYVDIKALPFYDTYEKKYYRYHYI